MENKLVIANLKAYLTHTQLVDWITRFIGKAPSYNLSDTKILLCPPASHLQLFFDMLHTSPLGERILLGAQDISAVLPGAHTGELIPEAVVPWASYTLIGHHERRMAGDTHESVQKKIERAAESELQSILCIDTPESYTGPVWACAYEPPGAIGSGDAASPEDVKPILARIKEQIHAQYYLYGGSVEKENVTEYLGAGFQGVLVGTHSRDPEGFLSLIEGL